jgi:hypothetical protein
MPVISAVLLGVAAGALYTLSPLTAWCVALTTVVLAAAGRGLPAADRRALRAVLIIALIARVVAVGALFVLNTPLHDDQSVSMLSGDEAYDLSRALRTRDVVTGSPVGQYDYFVAGDEYGRTSYITLLTGIQVLFGPTPYSMRFLNTLLFLIAAILLFRMTHAAFGRLPAFCGLIALLFLPTLFVWSISLMKEPLYLFGSTLVLTGVVNALTRYRVSSVVAAAIGVAIVSDLRPGAIVLALGGIGCGLALLAFFSLPRRFRIAAAVVAVLAVAAAGSTTFAQQRVTTALETTAKTHAGHVFTVGHSYKLLDDEFYVNPASAASSTLTFTPAEAARYLVRSAASFIAVPLPWQLASIRELAYLPEQMFWYVMIALLPPGIVAGWRRSRVATAMLAGFVLPTAAALALTNGNVGTLLRLRGIVIPYLLWLSAAGFCACLQRLAVEGATE